MTVPLERKNELVVPATDEVMKKYWSSGTGLSTTGNIQQFLH